MSTPTKKELWELSAKLVGADSDDHEDDDIIQPLFDLLQTLNNRQKEIMYDLSQPIAQKDFKATLKKICTSELSFGQLEELGIEDIEVDKSDPAGIVYKIVVASWEGEGGM